MICHKPSSALLRCLVSFVLLWAPTGHSEVELPGEISVDVLGERFSVTRYPARGDGLILWIGANHGTDERERPVARILAGGGIEVWRVDLAENLFLPKSTLTMRGLDGRHVAALIEQAHARTGKKVTLLGRAYGALPVLRGGRLWQLSQRASGGKNAHLAGAILFSPELYAEIPALGLPPVFDPVVDATSLPLMIFQAGSRNNRWQLGELLERLQQGGAQAYAKVLRGVTGIFYEGDRAPATLEAWRRIAPEITWSSALLESIPTPLSAPEMAVNGPQADTGLDTGLKPFEGNPNPHPLALPNAKDGRMLTVDFPGKVTVVNFWATWCPPCVEEIPSLNRLRQRMQGKDFELVSVDYAEDRQRVVAFMERVDVDFPVLLDSDGSVAFEWGVLVFPSTFVIGPAGEILYGVNGAIEWDSAEVVATLNALLEESADP